MLPPDWQWINTPNPGKEHKEGFFIHDSKLSIIQATELYVEVHHRDGTIESETIPLTEHCKELETK